MNKKVIYTACFAGYDILKKPYAYTSNWDYVCFTDDPNLEDELWQIRLIDKKGKMASREVKMLPHKYLADYEEWLYIDASIRPRNHLNFEGLEYNWLGFRHGNNDPFEEFHRIVSQGKGQVDILVKQLNDYLREGVQEKKGHMAGGVLYRRNTEDVRALCEAWHMEWLKYPSRDQASLYRVLHDSDCNWDYLDKHIKFENFEFNLHRFQSPQRNEAGMIYEFTPSGTGERFRDYGEALNRHCALVPYDEDWIIIRDQDTMYFPLDHRKIIREATMLYPDTGVFGAVTNRIGLQWQLVNEEVSENPSVTDHYKIAKKLQEDFGSECRTITQGGIAGFFMMFRKSTWNAVQFNQGDMADCDVLFDWAFSISVRDNLKLPLRVIKGLYLFHFYRFHKDTRDTSHIFEK